MIYFYFHFFIKILFKIQDSFSPNFSCKYTFRMDTACNATLSNCTETFEPLYTVAQSQLIGGLSILSAVLSSTYVISYFAFYKEMTRKTSYEILFYIQLSNVLTSLGSGNL